MTISHDDISAAIRFCSAFQAHYLGPNPLSAGLQTGDQQERQQVIDETWLTWSGFARTYFMGMLNIISGRKPLAIESEINRFCTPAETSGGRAAIEVFWRRDLARRAPVERRGAHVLNAIQRTILADNTINAEVFHAIEKNMETEIMQVLRSRRNFLRGLDPKTDHVTGLNADIAVFFGSGKPNRLSASDRNENFDGVLF